MERWVSVRWSLGALGVMGWLGCADPGTDAAAGSGSSTSMATTTVEPPSTTDALDGTTVASTEGLDSTGGGTTAAGSTGGSESGSSSGGEPLGPFAECFVGQFVNTVPELLPNYDQFDPVIGSHCVGTNHQDISGIERVVFLGDSVTVGSRPTLPGDVYRARLADMLRDEFSLAYADALSESLWKTPNPFTGQSVEIASGDFASCAEWGARNDDLLPPGPQTDQCFPPGERQARTLVIITSGGNDISSLTQDAINGVPLPDLWTAVEDFVQLKREAIEWLVTPGRFPNGVFVIFSNMYEFTDGTGEVQSCDVSGLAGFDQPVPSPDDLAELVIWANEQYVSIAVETGTDIYFMLETFCGHGFNNDDPTAPCYRGPDTPRWFDLTCIHPNPVGHGVIADDFMSIVLE